MKFSSNIWCRTITLTAIICCLAAPIRTSATPVEKVVVPAPIVANELYFFRQHEIENYIELAKNSPALTASQRKQVIDNLESALRYRELVDDYLEEADQFNAWLKSAPERIAHIKSVLNQPEPQLAMPADEVDELTLSDIDRRIRLGEIELVQATTNWQIMQDQLTNLSTLPQEIRKHISTSNRRSEEIRRELHLKQPGDDIFLYRASRIAMLESEQSKNRAHNRLAGIQLSSSATVAELYYAERNLAKRQIFVVESQLDTLRQLKQARLQQAVEAFQTETKVVQKKLGEAPESVIQQFGLNLQLVEEFNRLNETDAELEKRLISRQQQLEEIEEEFSHAIGKTDATIYSKSVGLWLREKHQYLPEIEDFEQRSKLRRDSIDRLQANRLEIVNRYNQLAQIEPEKRRILVALETLPNEKQVSISDALDQILHLRRDFLERLLKRYERSLDIFQRLNFVEEQLLARVRAYKNYLEQELLWLQDSEGFGLKAITSLPEALSWFENGDKWSQVLVDVKAAYRQQRALWIIVFLGAALLLASRPKMVRQLALLTKHADHIRKDNILLTIRGLVLTLVLAADFPSVMGFVGFQMTLVSESQTFSTAIGKGLINAAIKFMLIRFLIQLFRDHGLAQRHFGWMPQTTPVVQRTLIWLAWIIVPAAFIYAALQESTIIAYTDSLGRLAYMIMMISIGLFAARLLHQSGVWSAAQNKTTTSLDLRIRPMWYVLAIGVLFVLAGTAAAGYYYTALILDQPMQRTILLGMGLIITSKVLVRWMLISTRRMEYDRLIQQQKTNMQSMRETSLDDADKGLSMDGEAIAVQPPAMDYTKIEDQYLALLRFTIFFAAVIGLWRIWAEGLPVLNTLQNVEMWRYNVGIGEEIKSIPVSLKDLLISLIIIAATVVSARNLTGIFEVTFFKRLKPDAGTRNFFLAISRIIVIGSGGFAVFQIVGLHWSKLQWLVAALGVGLGFGLQEIVANFISGLVLLFERPYRVGDVVTIGTISGTVTNIQMRATTVTDWDRHELIVPNKEFISGQLINWSLSDPITRIVIPIGIAYGSDTELTEQLLLKVAHNHADVLDNPKPTALFRAFGNSSLDFELRVFISGVDSRLIVMHDLLSEIDRVFKANCIDFAFPQQDVHVDTSRPLDVRMVNEADGISSTERDTH